MRAFFFFPNEFPTDINYALRRPLEPRRSVTVLSLVLCFKSGKSKYILGDLDFNCSICMILGHFRFVRAEL